MFVFVYTNADLIKIEWTIKGQGECNGLIG